MARPASPLERGTALCPGLGHDILPGLPLLGRQAPGLLEDIDRGGGELDGERPERSG
jgi:hypothetical protein